jgi:hypothetical protein
MTEEFGKWDVDFLRVALWVLRTVDGVSELRRVLTLCGSV